MAIIKIKNPAIDLDAAEIPNLDASKITTGNFDASRIGSGTFADARIAASSVNQHATSFDDNKLVNDISTLALRQASNENKAAYNTNSMYVDVFQDATGITNLTNTARDNSEFISSVINDANTIYLNKFEANPPETDSSTNNIGISHRNSNVTRSSSQAKFGTYSLNADGSTSEFMRTATNSAFSFGSGDFTIECWIRPAVVNAARGIFGSTGQEYVLFVKQNGTLGGYFSSNGSSWDLFAGAGYGTLSQDTWHHIALSRASGTTKVFLDGTELTSFRMTNLTSISSNAINIGSDIGTGTGAQSWGLHGYLDEFRVSNNARYTSNFTPHTTEHQASTVNATGSFESNAITASASTNKMGAIITYQNQSGTNALNTDIVLKLSADGGSNYSTATLTAMPDFASGIKMAKVNDLSVTAGTSLKYKIEFANQASGSKEARIRGVSLQY